MRAGRCLALLGFAFPATAFADQNDVVNFVVGHTMQYESNLFRLSSTADPTRTIGKPNRDEVLRISALGLRLEKPLGLQKFEFNMQLLAYRYDSFQFLNFDGRNHNLAWRWRLTPDLSGSVSTSRSQAAANYADYRFGSRNVRTTESDSMNADWNPFGGWHFVAGAREDRQIQGQEFEEPDYRYRSVNTEVRYVFRSGSDLAVSHRAGQGDYLKQTVSIARMLDNHFDQSETEFRGTWKVSGKSSLQGRVATTARTHPHTPQRDFDGVSGRLEWFWFPTGKVQLAAAAGRTVAAWQGSSESYSIRDSISVGAVWRMAAKSSARLNAERSRWSLKGEGPVIAAVRRVDDLNTLQASLDWNPWQAVTLTASLRRDRRASNLPGLDYNSMVGTLGAQFIF